MDLIFTLHAGVFVPQFLPVQAEVQRFPSVLQTYLSSLVVSAAILCLSPHGSQMTV